MRSHRPAAPTTATPLPSPPLGDVSPWRLPLGSLSDCGRSCGRVTRSFRLWRQPGPAIRHSADECPGHPRRSVARTVAWAVQGRPAGLAFVWSSRACLPPGPSRRGPSGRVGRGRILGRRVGRLAGRGLWGGCQDHRQDSGAESRRDERPALDDQAKIGIRRDTRSDERTPVRAPISSPWCSILVSAGVAEPFGR